MLDKIIGKYFPEHRKGIVAVCISAILWSTGGLFIKLISLDAFQLSFYRSIFAGIAFSLMFRKKVLVVNAFTFMNSLFYAGILILFVIATKLTTAANAIFLQYTAPIYVLIFEPLILKVPFRLMNVISVIICFLGMTLFFVGDITADYYIGNIFALLSGILFACLMIGLKKNSPQYQVSSIFFGNILIILICAFSVFPNFETSTNDFLMVTFLGFIQIGIAYAVFTYALKRVQAIEASLIALLEPVLNPIWVYIGYGERPSAFAIIGGLIILTTIAVRTFLIEKELKQKNLESEII